MGSTYTCTSVYGANRLAVLRVADKYSPSADAEMSLRVIRCRLLKPGSAVKGPSYRAARRKSPQKGSGDKKCGRTLEISLYTPVRHLTPALSHFDRYHACLPCDDQGSIPSVRQTQYLECTGLSRKNVGCEEGVVERRLSLQHFTDAKNTKQRRTRETKQVLSLSSQWETGRLIAPTARRRACQSLISLRQVRYETYNYVFRCLQQNNPWSRADNWNISNKQISRPEPRSG
ncbi:hypothetical protein J6590_014259 [Homalodisca vitripennis]|nr:hypothetical protein J6590_014259 [Homalodisca vitripennis]